MQENFLLPDEKVISHVKSSMLVESGFWIGAILLALSLVSFFVLSFVVSGFLTITDITSKVGFSTSGYFWGAIPLLPTLLAVIGFFYVLYSELQVYFREYIVTNSRVVVEEGVINKKTNVLLPSKIENVNVDISVLERALGLGRVVVIMQMDSSPPIIIAGIRDPYKMQTDILKLIGKQTGDLQTTEKNDEKPDGSDKTN